MKKYCHNCFHPLPKKATFCPSCGQKDTDGRTTMRELFARFWNSTFHLQSKFVRMAWHLFNPAFVATEFFKGKQKRYPHPVQFFLIVMFFFLFYVNHRRGKEDKMDLFSIARLGNAEYVQGEVDLFETLRKHVDSLPEHLKTPISLQSIDTLLVRTERHKELGMWQRDSIPLDILDFLPDVNRPFALRDLLLMSSDSLLDYYQIKHPFSRLVIRQSIKSSKDGSGMLGFYVGSSTWTLLVLIAVMSWWLQVLYRRARRFYVENFVMLMLHHAGFLFMLTIVGVIRRVLEWKFVKTEWVLYWFIFGLLWAMKRYYGQGWGKTFLKWVIFWLVYVLVAVVTAFTSLFVCLLLF
jgi:hypothetical protein